MNPTLTEIQKQETSSNWSDELQMTERIKLILKIIPIFQNITKGNIDAIVDLATRFEEQTYKKAKSKKQYFNLIESKMLILQNAKLSNEMNSIRTIPDLQDMMNNPNITLEEKTYWEKLNAVQKYLAPLTSLIKQIDRRLENNPPFTDENQITILLSIKKKLLYSCKIIKEAPEIQQNMNFEEKIKILDATKHNITNWISVLTRKPQNIPINPSDQQNTPFQEISEISKQQSGVKRSLELPSSTETKKDKNK